MICSNCGRLLPPPNVLIHENNIVERPVNALVKCPNREDAIDAWPRKKKEQVDGEVGVFVAMIISSAVAVLISNRLKFDSFRTIVFLALGIIGIRLSILLWQFIKWRCDK
jgi:hypothetical protein